MALPSSLSYGQVKWRALAAKADGIDVDALPDATPVSGTVTFSATLTEPLAALDSTEPVTVFVMPVTYELDQAGVLRDSSGRNLITLVATDAAGVTPSLWTWTAAYNLSNGLSRGSINFLLPTNSVLDLTSVVPVQASTGEPVGVDAKFVRDTVAAALIPGTNTLINYDAAGGTLTIGTTATVNATNAQLRDRATHTGVQPITSVQGLTEALAAAGAPVSSQTIVYGQTVDASNLDDGTLVVIMSADV